jgi:hypothetical protein
MDERSKSGSSRNFMGGGKQIKATAEKEDSGAVVQEIAEAPGIGLQGLDFWSWLLRPGRATLSLTIREISRVATNLAFRP